MSQTTQYLTFGVDREHFALAVEQVQEILDLGPISRLPQAPEFVLGLMDVRRTGMLLIDLRSTFGLPRVEPTNRTRVIVVDATIEGQRSRVGLVADCVFDVTDLAGAALEPPPAIGGRWRPDYIVGVGRRNEGFVIVLKLEKLLGSLEPMIVKAA